MNTNLLLSDKHASSAQHTRARIYTHSVITLFMECISVLLHELLIRSKLWRAYWLTTVNTDVHTLKHTRNLYVHIKNLIVCVRRGGEEFTYGCLGLSWVMLRAQTQKNGAEKDDCRSDMSSIRVRRMRRRMRTHCLQRWKKAFPCARPLINTLHMRPYR